MYPNKWLTSAEKGLVSAAVNNWHPSTGESPRRRNSPPSQSECCLQQVWGLRIFFLPQAFYLPQRWHGKARLGAWLMTRRGGPRHFPPTVESVMPMQEISVCLGTLCIPFGRQGRRREAPASQVHARNVSFHGSAHSHAGIRISSHIRRPIYPDWLVVPNLELPPPFFWKCSNLQECYKNSTMSTVTQILLLALDTLFSLFECVCFVKNFTLVLRPPKL